MSYKKTIVLLIAEDDAEDRMLIREAFEESQLKNTVNFVENGEELMNYLRHEGKYADKIKYPTPGLILLDLNMPKMDGREALKEIKADENLRLIPVVVLTTSKAQEDVLKTYDLGVSSFITKPSSFAGLVEVTGSISKYWFDVVVLPRLQE